MSMVIYTVKKQNKKTLWKYAWKATFQNWIAFLDADYDIKEPIQWCIVYFENIDCVL